MVLFSDGKFKNLLLAIQKNFEMPPNSMESEPYALKMSLALVSKSSSSGPSGFGHVTEYILSQTDYLQ